MKRTSFFILAAAMIISLCACSEKISCSGDISFSLPRTISSRSEAAGVNQEITVSNYNVTLSQENETIESEDFKPETQIKFTDLTPGEYKITLKASMSDGSIFSGSKSVTVEAGKTAKCEIALYRDNGNGEADIPPVSIEGIELPEGFFTNTKYSLPDENISKNGFCVIRNKTCKAWLCDATGPFVLSTGFGKNDDGNDISDKDLFIAYYDGIETEISAITVNDINWSDIGTGTFSVQAIVDGEPQSVLYPVTIKYPVNGLTIGQGNDTITESNGMTFSFYSTLNPSIKIVENGITKESVDIKKILHFHLFIFSYGPE